MQPIESDEDLPKLSWMQRSVIISPLLRATRSFVRIPLGRDSTSAPVPKLVLRVGVAGHIKLPESGPLRVQVTAILESLKAQLHAAQQQYVKAFPDNGTTDIAECRLISQLAAGADQLVADCADKLGYILECPIPVAREEFAADIGRNPGMDKDPVAEFRRLMGKASVLELEELGQSENIPDELYKSSALAMLMHSDVLLALVRSDAKKEAPGTAWLIEEAGERAVPVIKLVIDKPADSRVLIGEADNQIELLLSDPNWQKALVEGLVVPPAGPGVTYRKSGWIVECFRKSVPAYEDEWPPNAKDEQGHRIVTEESAEWVKSATKDFYDFWSWAEQRANTYRDLYQGAYLSIALLGLLAVAGAVMGAHERFHNVKLAGKIIEIFAIIAMLLIWRATRKGFWRQRWLNYRWLEQQIRNASVLQLVGRTVPAQSSPVLAEVQKEGAWIAWYLRSVLRQARLPVGKLDQTRLNQAGQLILDVQIKKQIAYYKRSCLKMHLANHRLEKVAFLALILTLITAIGFVVGALWIHEIKEYFLLPALVMGLFGPALAASLAAVRAQGEFLQLETRYKGVKAHLEAVASQLENLLNEKSTERLTGRRLAKSSIKAAAAMLDEVSHWRSLLHTNEPEV